MTTVSQAVAVNARDRPDGAAFIDDDGVTTWAEYERRATDVAAVLVANGLERGERVAVLLPDGATVHAVFVGAERAGLVVAGIGPRAGRREIEHLVTKTGATALVSPAEHQAAGLPLRRHLVLAAHGAIPGPRADTAALAGRALGPDELFLLNSTSG